MGMAAELDELGLSAADYLDDGADGTDGFEAAAATVVEMTAKKKLAREQLLGFYGLYKQATEGDAPAKPPASAFAVIGAGAAARFKWAAWDSRRGMDANTARQEYVAMLRTHEGTGSGAEDGNADAAETVFGGSGFGGHVFSRPCDSSHGDFGAQACASGRVALHDAVIDGDIAAVRAVLARAAAEAPEQMGAFVDARDDDGASALMLAADRGNSDTLILLLEHGASVDSVDDTGQCDDSAPRLASPTSVSHPLIIMYTSRRTHPITAVLASTPLPFVCDEQV